MNRKIKLSNINVLYLLKTAIGSATAIFIATFFGLLYSSSAGIITLLTIQNTKKETILVSIRRILAFFIAVIVSFTMFSVIGFKTIAFGCFLFVFVALCSIFQLKEGISMSAVLTTHFLNAKRMDGSMLLNEIFLLMIGMGIGIIVNLIMPKNKERIRKDQFELDEMIRQTLRGMADTLKNKDACLLQNNEGYIEFIENNKMVDGDHSITFDKIDLHLESLLKTAYENAGNTLLTDTRYLVSYLEMRKIQVSVLKKIMINIDRIPVILVQSLPVSDFMSRIADTFHEFNNVEILLNEMNELHEFYRKESLPETRDEFEYRAILFQIFTDLKYFLELKKCFILEIEQKNMRSYWS